MRSQEFSRPKLERQNGRRESARASGQNLANPVASDRVGSVLIELLRNRNKRVVTEHVSSQNPKIAMSNGGRLLNVQLLQPIDTI